jgi:hypothetical protein
LNLLQNSIFIYQKSNLNCNEYNIQNNFPNDSSLSTCSDTFTSTRSDKELNGLTLCFPLALKILETIFNVNEKSMLSMPNTYKLQLALLNTNNNNEVIISTFFEIYNTR